MHSLFMRLTALPSFCQTVFLPVSVHLPHLITTSASFFLYLLLPHLCLPGFLSDPLLTMKWTLTEGAAFDGMSRTKTLMRETQTHKSVSLSLSVF